MAERTTRPTGSPEGMVVANGLGKASLWKVGRKIGEGAEKTVYLLESPETDTKWAIKVVPSCDRCFCKWLRDEFELLDGPLKPLQGTVVPTLPRNDGDSPQAWGEQDGWTFSVQEMMESELLPSFDALLNDARAKKQAEFDLSGLVIKLMSMCQSLHQLGYLNVDIKPDNLMFNKRGQLCVVDFGQVAKISPDPEELEWYACFLGTPVWTALSVKHNSGPRNPREDIETLTYVLSDLILRSQQCNVDNVPTCLPWVVDPDLHSAKEKNVKDLKSQFYTQMPEDAAKKIKAVLDLIWACNDSGDNKLPPYDVIAQILIQLKVPIPPVESFNNAPSDDAPSDDAPSDDTPSDDALSDDAPSDDDPSDNVISAAVGDAVGFAVGDDVGAAVGVAAIGDGIGVAAGNAVGDVVGNADDAPSDDDPSDDAPSDDDPSDDAPSDDDPSDDDPSDDALSGDAPSGDAPSADHASSNDASTDQHGSIYLFAEDGRVLRRRSARLREAYGSIYDYEDGRCRRRSARLAKKKKQHL